jgi:hypothetical protein
MLSTISLRRRKRAREYLSHSFVLAIVAWDLTVVFIHPNSGGSEETVDEEAGAEIDPDEEDEETL